MCQYYNICSHASILILLACPELLGWTILGPSAALELLISSFLNGLSFYEMLMLPVTFLLNILPLFLIPFLKV